MNDFPIRPGASYFDPSDDEIVTVDAIVEVPDALAHPFGLKPGGPVIHYRTEHGQHSLRSLHFRIFYRPMDGFDA